MSVYAAGIWDEGRAHYPGRSVVLHWCKHRGVGVGNKPPHDRQKSAEAIVAGLTMAKIRIIDDKEQLLKIMKTYLEHDNHEITVASDGMQGISQLKAHTFDLVITDIIMPEKDGFEVLIWLKTQINRPKVLVMTGASSLDINYLVPMAKQFSVDKVMQKPFDFETLKTTVLELLAT